MRKKNKKKTTNKKSGLEIYGLIKRLYPFCRSITGNGVRETLNIIKEYIPLKITEVPSGTKVFDWVVPEEWNIRDAYVKAPGGGKVIDFKKSNIHVVGYSTPILKKMNLSELKKHLYTLPEFPERIPYVTSYYNRNWGFCLKKKDYDNLKNGTYDVFIDSSIKKGFLTYGELFVKGSSREEVLLSTYLCHPSLCNDNLSGVALLAILAMYLKDVTLRYSYRFLFIPETIGAITWLSRNEKNVTNIKHGIVVTCVGDAGKITYKRSRMANAEIDRAIEKVLIDSKEPYAIIDFNPADGSDERQFCSPAFNLPVGSLMRTPYSQFSEYHTSVDNLDFINAEFLGNSFKKYLDVIFILENNVSYLNLYSKGEPMLDKRNLYRSVSHRGMSLNESAIFWLLNFSDGQNSLLDISMRSGLAFKEITATADVLVKKGLLK